MLYDQLSAGMTRSTPTGQDMQRPASEPSPANDLVELLARERRRMETLTAILGGWVWETDREHKFTYMSPSVARFAGRPPEWHYGKTRQELGNMSVATLDGRSWTAQLEAHAVFGPVDFIRYQGRQTFLLRTIGHPQFDADGGFTGYCGVAFALTSDVEAEAAERRSAERRRMVRAAEITIPGEAGVVSCVLVDISTSGAKLRVPGDVRLPVSFQLAVAAMSLEVNCELRWRRGDDIGVEFAG